MTEIDGRTARRDANRAAVLDAVVELFTLGEEPTPERVARQSGVSLRSVYRYFDDRRELTRAAIERQIERLTPVAQISSIGEGPFDSRVERFVSVRLALYETAGPTARAGRARAVHDPLLAERVAFTHGFLRDQLARQFADEFAALAPDVRATTLDALDTLCQFESLDYLVGRDDAAAADVLRRALRGLLGA